MASNTISLAGRVALVTGSTSGIGLGIANVLAEAGADIVLNGFGDQVESDRIATDLASRHGVRTRFIGADISDPEACAAMVQQAAAALGAVDILVNNAGIQHTALIEEFPLDQWQKVITINLSGAFFLMRAALPGMKAKGWGRVVNIASAHGLVASASKSAYVAAKHGLLGLTKVAAIECANEGVTVNAVCPGWVLTPLVEKQIAARATRLGTDPKAEAQAMVAEKQPMTRFSTPESIGAAALYFCSENAATVTGTHLSVDGGWTAQ
jgi:3-hydroxybutyrate dehydrogenase